MRRRIPGLSAEKWLPEAAVEGTFLVRVESAEYCHDSRKPFFAIKLELLQPQLLVRHLRGASIAHAAPFGSSIGFCVILATTPIC
jgi:hypothetical protein